MVSCTARLYVQEKLVRSKGINQYQGLPEARAPLKVLNLRTLYRKIENPKEERRRQADQVPLSARYVANASPATVDREEVTRAGIPARGEVQGTRGLLKALASGS